MGAQLSDVVDNDPDVGPHRLKREVSQDIDVQVEENKKTDAEVTEEESTLYTKDHVLYVYDTPICASKTIQVAFVVSVGEYMYSIQTIPILNNVSQTNLIRNISPLNFTNFFCTPMLL